MRILNKVIFIGLFTGFLLSSQAQPNTFHPIPKKMNPLYVYTPVYSCEGYFWGNWYLGYRVGEDSCDIQVENKIVVRVYRYFPI